jgi:hypothetical protein
MIGLVPTIQASAGFGACGTLDPRDKPEDDTGICWCQSTGAVTPNGVYPAGACYAAGADDRGGNWSILRAADELPRQLATMAAEAIAAWSRR